MKARAKATGSTPDRVMEIVGLLLRRIIEAPSELPPEHVLVKSLEESGYGRAEIDAAMELVFAVPEIISPSNSDRPCRPLSMTTRVFSLTESFKLGLTVRGRLLQYRILGLLSESEWEEVMMQLLLFETREVGLAELHSALSKVVEDEQRLLLLLPNSAKPVPLTIN